MMLFYINGTERSTDVTEGTLVLNKQGAQRSDNCAFEVYRGSKPLENQDLKIYDADLVSSIASNVITVQGKFEPNTNKFYAGQELWVRIGQLNTEKVVVQSYNEATLQITLVNAPFITVSNGDKLGELTFGGFISHSKDLNLDYLANIVYQVTALDYSKFFDKKIIGDTWQNVDCRYIINDFTNSTINYNQTLDNLSYANNTAIQAAYAKYGDGNLLTVDTTDFIEGTSSAVMSWTHTGTGSAWWQKIISVTDLVPFSGIAQTNYNLKANYTFEEGAGSVTDHSLNGLTGSIVTPHYGTGIRGNCIVPNGTNGYVNATDTTGKVNFTNTDSFSISCWFKASVSADQSISEHWDDGATGYPWCLRGPYLHQLLFASSDGVNNPGVQSIGAPLDDGVWHHVVGVKDAVNKIYSIFIDGIFNNSTTYTTLNNTANSIKNFAIGARSTGGGSVFNGSIDEFRIYNKALSSDEITALHNLTLENPTKGSLMFWYKTTDNAKISNMQIALGSTGQDYAFYVLPAPVVVGEWAYINTKLSNFSTIVGSPLWSQISYLTIGFPETATGSIKLNGIRVNDDTSFTLFNVQKTFPIPDFRSPQLKPTALMNQFAKANQYVWNIDYERDIHFATDTALPAPYSLTDTSNNFFDLQMEADTSNLGNRIIINGGSALSTSRYAQTFEGDSVERAWLLKNEFDNLIITIDDNTTTHAAESGTTTTNIKITGHGLSAGDHVNNRTRKITLRVDTVVDANNFTVLAVVGQTTGDSISYFAITKTAGIEGLVDEAAFDYLYNGTQKSVRASTQTPTLLGGYPLTSVFIRFAYNEMIPIQIQYGDSSSIQRLKDLGLGDGVFDLAPITDSNITDLSTALLTAQAKVAEFSNAVITGTFNTDKRGLKAGQLIHVTQTLNRGLDDYFVIQKVNIKQTGGKYQDYLTYNVTFATTLFGWVELMQKVLKNTVAVGYNISAIVETFVEKDELMKTLEVNSTAKGGFKKATFAEVPNITTVNLGTKWTNIWEWEPSTGQPLATRWDLFSWQ